MNEDVKMIMAIKKVTPNGIFSEYCRTKGIEMVSTNRIEYLKDLIFKYEPLNELIMD